MKSCSLATLWQAATAPIYPGFGFVPHGFGGGGRGIDYSFDANTNTFTRNNGDSAGIVDTTHKTLSLSSNMYGKFKGVGRALSRPS